VGLERGPFSFVRAVEELLEWKSSGSGLGNRKINGRRDPLRWPRDTLYPLKLALTWPTCGGCSVGIVRLRLKAMEFSLYQQIWNNSLSWSAKNSWIIYVIRDML
jgi:hypothetical protein